MSKLLTYTLFIKNVIVRKLPQNDMRWQLDIFAL